MSSSTSFGGTPYGAAPSTAARAHAVERLHQVDEWDPRLEAVLAPLRDELAHGEDRVGAATLLAEAALRLVVERLHDRVEARLHDVRDDLVHDLEHHDAAVVARVAQVAFLRQDGEQAALPSRRHRARLPELEHGLADDVDLAHRNERLEERRGEA